MTIGESVAQAPGRKAIVYGEDSLLFNEDSIAYLNELAHHYEQPQIPIVAIPNARHHLMLDQPIAFATALRSVLSWWATADV